MLLVMILAHIALFALTFPSALPMGQTFGQGVLKVQVEDFSGVRISGARIQLRSKDLSTFSDTRADTAGEAVVPLTPGTYTISVVSQGFEEWSEILKLDQGQTRIIRARLEIGRAGGISVESGGVQTEIEHRIPDITIAEIPLVPLALPPRPLRRHRWVL